MVFVIVTVAFIAMMMLVLVVMAVVAVMVFVLVAMAVVTVVMHVLVAVAVVTVMMLVFVAVAVVTMVVFVFTRMVVRGNRLWCCEGKDGEAEYRCQQYRMPGYHRSNSSIKSSEPGLFCLKPEGRQHEFTMPGVDNPGFSTIRPGLAVHTRAPNAPCLRRRGRPFVQVASAVVERM
ncbi:MAG: hypothetical protein V2I25_13615 [Woeseiaceae bacterium]|nr:hypothetical protein [Woeseiaceae bacterium]